MFKNVDELFLFGPYVKIWSLVVVRLTKQLWKPLTLIIEIIQLKFIAVFIWFYIEILVSKYLFTFSVESFMMSTKIQVCFYKYSKPFIHHIKWILVKGDKTFHLVLVVKLRTNSKQETIFIYLLFFCDYVCKFHLIVKELYYSAYVPYLHMYTICLHYHPPPIYQY